MELDVMAVLLFLQTMLLAIVGWLMQHFIRKDDEWKRCVDRKLDELTAVRTGCLREFASRDSMNEAFGVLRDHGGRISAL